MTIATFQQIGGEKQMAEQKTSMGWRIVEIIAGIIVLVLGGYAIAYPGVAAATLIAFLAVGLLILSGIELVRVFSEGISGWRRLWNLILSIIALLLAIAILVYPLIIGGAVLGWILALALIFAGLAAVGRGTPGMMIVGVIAIILGLVALFVPLTGALTLVLLVAIGLIIFGLELLVAGLLGRWV
jgi:uncharacterized membrane protein HdeD (DUF308 family)